MQASLHFCSECNNLLYPKADTGRRIMVYACRICSEEEIGENKCVYRNDLLTVTKQVLRTEIFLCHISDLKSTENKWELLPTSDQIPHWFVSPLSVILYYPV
jgi:DNA-directed RNA polymerase subunit M/transcription elongation factor TFIIS